MKKNIQQIARKIIIQKGLDKNLLANKDVETLLTELQKHGYESHISAGNPFISHAHHFSDRKHENFIMNHLYDLFYETDEKGNILYVSGNIEKVFGIVPNKITSLNINDVPGIFKMNKDTLEKIKQKTREAVNAGQEYVKYEFSVTVNQNEHWLESNEQLLYNEKGNYQGSLGVIRDITAVKNAWEDQKAAKKRYKVMIENFPNGAIFMFNDQLRYTSIGGKGLEKAGLNSESLIGKTVYEAFPDSVSRIAGPQCELIFENNAVYYEVEYNGRKYANWGVPLVSDEGTIEEGIIYALDISELKQKKAEIVKSKELLQSILDNITDTITRTDINGNIIYASPSWHDAVGYAPEEVEGTNIFQYVHPDERIEMRNKFEAGILSGKQTAQYRFKHKNGFYLWCEAKGKTIQSNGKIAGIVIGATVIHKTKIALDKIKEHNKKITRINDELRKTKEKAEESDRLKTIFLAMMSHELRTPLNAIIGFSEMVENDTPLEEVTEYIDIIKKSGYALLSIIESIFDITLLESKKISIKKQPVSLESILQDINLKVFEYKKHYEKEHLKFETRVGKENLFINTDKIKLTKALSLLLDNAIKFTYEGYVEVGYHKQPKQVVIYIKDTGIGIPLHKQQLVFEKFRMVDESHSRKYGGVGLGLTTSKELLMLLGYQIELESSPGHGSVFYVLIPEDDIVL